MRAVNILLSIGAALFVLAAWILKAAVFAKVAACVWGAPC